MNAPVFEPAPRFNHVAMSVSRDLLTPAGRSDLLRFYGEVFGWSEMPAMSEDGKLLVLRAYRNDQFVFLAASDDPMCCDAKEHWGMSVATPDMLDRMYDAARKLRDEDPRVEIIERKTDDFKAVKLHSFYVRFRVPLWTEVQCFEWAEGIDEQSLP